MNNQVKMIRAEIERYVDSLERNSGMAGPFGDAQMALCDRLLSFIDSLQEPVSVDLANAAIEYCGGDKGSDARVRAAFVVGANWQKEQMMKDAIECNIGWYDGPLLDYTQQQQDKALDKIGAKIGDKVKLIIIKGE